MSYKLEKLYENSKIKENKKQLSKLPKIIYNKYNLVPKILVEIPSVYIIDN